MILLDTHAWIWWQADPARLSGPAREAIDRATALAISTLSLWELATLARRGRLTLDRDVRDWAGAALRDPRLTAVPPSAQVGLTAGLLDGETFTGDPVDRLIFSTARALEAPLVTRDERLRAFAPSATLW